MNTTTPTADVPVMGRPPLPPGQARYSMANVRFNEAEFQMVQAVAKAADKSIATWMRKIVLRECRRRLFKHPEILDAKGALK